ncbi:hypothetical protein CALCODRAFT_503079 [Calocera cornea HHB12733]|uniref:Uncharacterized protein n=1 Tax=Calocera cornea HHB12733 TaxID=1353952 RepID=A0A165D0B9_9BASI|nr:hypothetical protein CALCODRAFT_503079 [Calocera cornea HHB12733]
MMFLWILAIIFGLVVAQPGAHTVAIAMILPDSSNAWIELSFSMTVPELPPLEVMENWDGNPWYFWCGLQTGTPGGPIQPVLMWGKPTNLDSGYIGDGGWSQYSWIEALWLVPDLTLNLPEAFVSPGIDVSPGDELILNVVLVDGQWRQSASCVSGSCQNQMTTLNVDWDKGLSTSVANTLVCEAELYGDYTNQWNFDVTFKDVSVLAANSDGVESVCANQVSHSDNGGYVTVGNLEMGMDGRMCTWDYITVSPP